MSSESKRTKQVLKEIIKQLDVDIKECAKGAKAFVKVHDYYRANEVIAMAKAFEKIKWRLKRMYISDTVTN